MLILFFSSVDVYHKVLQNIFFTEVIWSIVINYRKNTTVIIRTEETHQCSEKQYPFYCFFFYFIFSNAPIVFDVY